jgi:hypothetical protein
LLDHLTHEWVNFDTFMHEHGAKIPPGPALRKYRGTYEQGVNQRKPIHPTKPALNDEQAIESGRRTLLRSALRSAVQAGLVVMRDLPDGNKEVRRNEFSAEYIDALLSRQKVAEPAPVPKPELLPVPVPTVTEIVSVQSLPQLMFDHKNIKRDIEVRHSSSAVIVIIKDVIDDVDLTMLFSAPASDWFSDQLGMQAMFIRGGRENPEKIFRT